MPRSKDMLLILWFDYKYI